MAKKAILRFKVVSNLFKKLQIRFHIPSDAPLQDVFREFNVLLLRRFQKSCSEEILSELLLGGYRLRSGRGGPEIFASSLPAYDHFCGADALLELEVDEKFNEMPWE